jgi:ATP-binding cassette subfamily C protein
MLPFQAAMLSMKGTIPAAETAQEILQGLSDSKDEGRRTFSRELNQENNTKPVRVMFDSVNFAYSGADVLALDNLTFEISPGEQVAFIGASGAGKSTIADLMCGVLTPSQGRVSLSVSGKGISFTQNATVSYVPQKPGLVSGTVAENIALGVDKAETDEARVLKALQNAHLKEVIGALPAGVHTNLGKYKDGLSGGQIQRLGLARALYSEPGLLVMDEATSALDAESESEITKALEQMRGKVTVVLIAHRLNTVQHADRVFLIEEGRVADSGTFRQLVNRNPSVRRLVQLMKLDNG